uniref:Uncharacterized protein n=1 Tax=Arundo donax TaxID=35708 RepID=A0A0A8YLC9_ARUDO
MRTIRMNRPDFSCQRSLLHTTRSLEQTVSCAPRLRCVMPMPSTPAPKDSSTT